MWSEYICEVIRGQGVPGQGFVPPFPISPPYHKSDMTLYSLYLRVLKSQFVVLRSTADILNSGYSSLALDRIMTCWGNEGVSVFIIHARLGLIVDALSQSSELNVKWMSTRPKER